MPSWSAGVPDEKAAGVTIFTRNGETASHPVRRGRHAAIARSAQTLRVTCKRCVGPPSCAPEEIAFRVREVSSVAQSHCVKPDGQKKHKGTG